MNISEQQQEIHLGNEAPKQPYSTPVLSELGDMARLTQGTLALSVVALLSSTLVDIVLG